MNLNDRLKNSLAACIMVLPLLAQAQTAPTVELAPYLPAAYTESFSRSIEMLATGKAEGPNGAVKAVISGTQKPGSRVMRFDREWIGVASTGLVMFGDEKFDTAQLYLFDPKSGRQTYMIDQDDGSTTHYEWMAIPTRLTLGETSTVGKLTAVTKDNKLAAVGLLALRATETKAGLEFCQIETVVEAESGDKRVSEDCLIFDKSRKPITARASVETEGKKILEVNGPIKLR